MAYDEEGMENDSPSIRRQFPRQPVDLPATISNDERAFNATSRLMDLSRGGAALKTQGDIKKEETLLVSIAAENDSFEGYGKVAWTRKEDDFCHTGIKFLYMTDRSLATLSRLLQAES